MAKLYHTILTDTGKTLVAQAIREGGKVDIAGYAVGDGDGGYYVPDAVQSALKREVYRGDISRLTAGGDTISAEMALPASVTGFTLREVGLLTADGNLVAVGNLPDIPRDEQTDGAIGDILLTMVIRVANTDVFDLVVDPNSIVITRPMLDAAVQDIHSVYDADGDGIIDRAAYAADAVDQTARTSAAAAQNAAKAAMPITGGTFAGNVAAYSTNRQAMGLRNNLVQTAAGAAVSTNYLLFRRK